MKSQLGFKLNLFFFVSLFSCILNIPRSPQVLSDTLEMHSLPIRVFPTQQQYSATYVPPC